MRRKTLWPAVAVMILSVLLFTVSCAKKMVQDQQVSTTEPEIQKSPDRTTTEPEVQKVPERSAEVVEKAGRREEDRRLAEEAVREAAKAAFIGENVHFAFNSFELSDQAMQVLNNKADYLRMNPGITVTVEGYCDERGTNAYNVVLGERRAESAKVYLVGLGVSGSRLHTVTYGEERPVAAGHNEASWAENRRVQFLIN